MDFSKINSSNSSTAALLGALNKTSIVRNTNYDRVDEWNVTRDKSGNGSAVIRFIPSPDGELFMEVKNHGFKNDESGRWFIENCPKTLDWENGCPCCDHANDMKRGREWKTIPEAEQKKISKFFPKTSYWANVLVIKDPDVPENEGKVFKFRFGKKILEKIMARASDDEMTETTGINVFDLVDGANFKIDCKKVAGWPNYDGSTWLSPSPVAKGKDAEEKMNEIVKSGHDIGWLRSDKNFKEFAELIKKFNSTMGTNVPATTAAEDVVDESIPDAEDETVYDSGLDSNVSEDDEDLDYFSNLANENV